MGTLHRTDVVSYVGARISLPMPGTPRCSDLAAYAEDSSVLGHRCLRRGLLAPRCSVIASDAGDSSLLDARSSSATPGTPRSSLLGHRRQHQGLLAPRSSVLGHRCLCRGLLAPRWSVIASDAGDSLVLPWWSDLATSHRCAIKLLHAVRIRVLILGSTSGVLIRACQTTSASF